MENTNPTSAPSPMPSPAPAPSSETGSRKKVIVLGIIALLLIAGALAYFFTSGSSGQGNYFSGQGQMTLNGQWTDKGVELTWEDATPGVGMYVVTRSDVSGGQKKGVASVSSKSKQYIDTSVVKGSQYFYVVNAMGARGRAALATSNEAGVQTVVMTQVPNLELTVDGQKEVTLPANTKEVKLTWSASNLDNIALYTVFQSKTSPVNLQGSAADGVYQYSVNDSAATSFTDTSTLAGKTYYYVIVAKDKNGILIGGEFAKPSNEVKVIIEKPAAKIAEIKLLKSEKVQFGQNYVWVQLVNFPMPKLDKYWFYKSASSPVDTSGEAIASLAQTKGSNGAMTPYTTYIDNAFVADGKPSYYKVLAKDKDGNIIGESNEITVETESAPLTITLQTPTLDNNNRPVLKWSASDDKPHAYDVFRQEGNAEMKKLTGAPKTTTGINDLNDTKPGTYSYYVQADNQVKSNTVTITIPDPFGLSIASISSSGEVKLQWKAWGNTAGYVIFRSETAGQKGDMYDSTGGTTFTDTIEAGKTYYYIIQTNTGIQSSQLAVLFNPTPVGDSSISNQGGQGNFGQ